MTLDQIRSQIRKLPLDEVQALVQELKIGQEWQWFENEGRGIGHFYAVGAATPKATLAQTDCRQWVAVVESAYVGQFESKDIALDATETELELKGYLLHWRKGEP